MIEGIIAYHMDDVDSMEAFIDGNDQDVNCWVYENGYPADEIMMMDFKVLDQGRLNTLLEYLKNHS